MSKRRVTMAAFAAVLALGGMTQGALSSPVSAASGAISTTTDPSVDNGGTGTPTLCLNGPSSANTSSAGAINCNIYTSKNFVWLSGLPVQAALGAGTYFFAVMDPGGQPSPNDGGAKNLSDMDCLPWTCPATNADGTSIPSGDLWSQREFSVDGFGNITSCPTDTAHTCDQINNKIRLMPYDDTTNPGGVYILAVCAVPAAPNPSSGDGAPGADPSACKYDAFKVRSEGEGVPPAVGLTLTKDAAGSYTDTYTWTITKAVDKTLVKQVGGNATFNYTVTATHDSGTVTNVQVTGTIQVFNLNDDGSGNTVPVTEVDVTDQLSDGTTCTVTDGSGVTVSSVETDFAYTCDLSAVPTGELDNTATVSWPDQTLSDNAPLAGGSDDFTFSNIAFTATLVDNCVTLTDTFTTTATTLGVACADGTWTIDSSNKLTGFAESYTAPTFTLTYSRSIAVPAHNCLFYSNTAAFTTNDTSATGSASQTVEVCGPALTGALTMGFWQNKNGQAIITGQKGAGACPSAAWLTQFNPFMGGKLSSASTCSGVAMYVTSVIKAATCSGPASAPCNAMLKAQDLATSLDVYFSDPTLGGNKINAPAPVGGVSIDLTKICKMIDGSGGTATCGGTYENVSSAFVTGTLETVPGACSNTGVSSMTVLCMLWNAASNSASGGIPWYGTSKATQVLAKDGFDAINNQVAFSA
jgi:hypothetical protein